MEYRIRLEYRDERCAGSGMNFEISSEDLETFLRIAIKNNYKLIVEGIRRA